MTSWFGQKVVSSLAIVSVISNLFHEKLRFGQNLQYHSICNVCTIIGDKSN